MVKAPTPDTIAASLTVPERVLLFCLASSTDWRFKVFSTWALQHALQPTIMIGEKAAEMIALDHGVRLAECVHR
jgi:hypothetical protein